MNRTQLFVGSDGVTRTIPSAGRELYFFAPTSAIDGEISHLLPEQYCTGTAVEGEITPEEAIIIYAGQLRFRYFGHKRTVTPDINRVLSTLAPMLSTLEAEFQTSGFLGGVQSEERKKTAIVQILTKFIGNSILGFYSRGEQVVLINGEERDAATFSLSTFRGSITQNEQVRTHEINHAAMFKSSRKHYESGFVQPLEGIAVLAEVFISIILNSPVYQPRIDLLNAVYTSPSNYALNNGAYQLFPLVLHLVNKYSQVLDPLVFFNTFQQKCEEIMRNDSSPFHFKDFAHVMQAMADFDQPATDISQENIELLLSILSGSLSNVEYTLLPEQRDELLDIANQNRYGKNVQLLEKVLIDKTELNHSWCWFEVGTAVKDITLHFFEATVQRRLKRDSTPEEPYKTWDVTATTSNTQAFEGLKIYVSDGAGGYSVVTAGNDPIINLTEMVDIAQANGAQSVKIMVLNETIVKATENDTSVIMITLTPEYEVNLPIVMK